MVQEEASKEEPFVTASTAGGNRKSHGSPTKKKPSPVKGPPRSKVVVPKGSTSAARTPLPDLPAQRGPATRFSGRGRYPANRGSQQGGLSRNFPTHTRARGPSRNGDHNVRIPTGATAQDLTGDRRSGEPGPRRTKAEDKANAEAARAQITAGTLRMSTTRRAVGAYPWFGARSPPKAASGARRGSAPGCSHSPRNGQQPSIIILNTPLYECGSVAR